MAGIADARVRLGRAKANCQRLKNDIITFGRKHPNAYRALIEQDGKGNCRVAARITERPPTEWGLAVGDLLVDLRCALDYAVYALAIEHSGEPVPTWAHRLEFPITITETRWGEAIRRHSLDGLNDAAIEFIKSVQPWQGQEDGSNGALAALDELVGINKHRFIATVWSRLHALNLTLKTEGMQIEDMTGFSIPGELKDGAVLATFRLVASHKAKIQIETSLATVVVIEPTSKGWLRIDDFFPKIGAFVEYLVGELEGFLTPGHEAPSPDAPTPLTPW